MKETEIKRGWSTRAIHGGEDREREHRPLTTPIFQTATYRFDTTELLQRYYEGKPGAVAEYGRYGNPTRAAAEQKLRLLEDAAGCDLYPSGMSALTTLFYFYLKPGDHIIMTSDNYRGTRKFLENYLVKAGVSSSFVDVNIASIEAAITPQTRMVFTEVPTNPFLYVLDLSELSRLCKSKNIISVVDATLASPFNLQPLKFGIDFVTHSLTKYLSGHNDLIMGAVLSNDTEKLNELRNFHNLMGSHVDPQAVFLLLRGLKTYALRIERHNHTSLALARWLESQPGISVVYYPGLESHRDYQIANKQMKGFGGVISFEAGETFGHAARFCDSLQLITIGASLGGVESLIHPVRVMSFSDLDDAGLKDYGVAPNLIRLAVGLEDLEDLQFDIANALEVMQKNA